MGMSFHISAHREGPHASLVECKSARIEIDTDLAGRLDAFNPAELLLAALAGCILKGIERVCPILQFQLRAVHVDIDGVRQDVPPRLEAISYRILVDTDESDARLDLLHENVRKYGTVYNTVAPGTILSGTLERVRHTS